MKRFKFTIHVPILIGLALVLTIAPTARADQEEITSALSSDQEVGPAVNDSSSFGAAEAEIEIENGAAEIKVQFDLTINEGREVTRVHIHRGDVGVNGPIVVSFFDTVTGQNNRPLRVRKGAFRRTFKTNVDSALADEITQFPERFYFNVHTEVNPAGELRGQLGNAPEDLELEIISALSSEQEVDPAANDSGSFGAAETEIEIEDGAAEIKVQFDLTINEGRRVTRVHIHRGDVGVNGPIVVSFFDTVTGQNQRPLRVRKGEFSRAFRTEVDSVLADEIAMFPERFYFNVHSEVNPAGELRGQLGNAPEDQDLDSFSALSSDQEVDTAANSSGSFGAAEAEIEIEGGAAAIEVRFDLTINDGRRVTRLHIHRGDVGVNGPIVVSFFDTVTGQNRKPLRVRKGAFRRTFKTNVDSVLADEIAKFPERFYFNVHTEVNPAGELRGQLGNAPDDLELEILSTLSSDQEVGPAANDSGSFGEAEAEIEIEDGAAAIEVQFDLTINEGRRVTRVHIHRGDVGVNGPIVVSFFDTVTGQNRRPLRVRGGEFSRSFKTNVDSVLADEIAKFPERFYFNVHTEANPAGELRGQLGN